VILIISVHFAASENFSVVCFYKFPETEHSRDQFNFNVMHCVLFSAYYCSTSLHELGFENGSSCP
jgi:hypothetical protein